MNSKDQEIKNEILRIMDKAKALDKHKIFRLVSYNLNVPIPTVRRVCRDLRLELIKKLEVLQT